MDKIPVIVIGGPTASGKTALSIELAKKYNTQIVSADGMQIYKYMDIGTAKPTQEEKEGIFHYMIDIITPDTPYSVAQYVTDAHKCIKEIYDRGKTPIIVGGTGLYINSLINDVDFLENDSDTSIREELEEFYNKNGADALYDELKKIDEKASLNIHKNNVRRVIRAIEFYKMTGVPISQHQEETKKKISRYLPCMLAIKWDMEKLYERIDKRVDIMVEEGLIQEVEGLFSMGYENAVLSMQGIGYKEILQYLKGEITKDEAIEKIKLNTRHYAKRQMTWFRKDERIHWLDYKGDVLSQAVKILEEKGF